MTLEKHSFPWVSNMQVVVNWRARVLPGGKGVTREGLLLLVADVHPVNVDPSSQHRPGTGTVC